MSRRRTLLLALALVGAAMAVIAFRADGRARQMAHPPREHVTPEEDARARQELPGRQDVTLRTSDSLTLRGWFAPGTRRAAVVLVHGWGGNRAQLLPEAGLLARHGYGILVYDSRASGESEGDLVSWGDGERRDVTAAVDFVSSRAEIDPGRIGALGFSLGSSSLALEAAGDPRVRAVVLQATWSSMQEEVAEKAGRFGPLSTGPALLRLRYEGIDVNAVRPIDRVAEIAPRPLLLIAGETDADTPVAVMQRVFAAARDPKELWIEPDATHGSYVRTAPEEYERRVTGFFDRNL
jgi:dipeptidyl aminopeptidase/acylaminoacyl peptidase